MKYPHKTFNIHISINETIEKLEDNMMVFANRLAEREKDMAHPYYQSQKYQLSEAIALLKQARDKLGSLDWV